MNEDEIKDKLRRWDSYISLGDSHTEGMMDCEDGQDAEAPMVGWADRLAGELSARREENGLPPLRYANLAVRGKKLNQVAKEQFGRALAQKPALISVVAGGNDLIRPSADPDSLARRLESLVVQARSRGIDVLMGTNADPKGSPIIAAMRPRVATFNTHIWSIARRHGCFVVDMWGLRTLRTRLAWAPDRLHLSTTGHQLVTQAALVALGLQQVPPDFDAYQGQELTSWTAAQHAQWAHNHFFPWVHRHLHGRSSGDGRPAKYPTLEPFPPTLATNR